jgi:cytochrome o ubiquinol oxidase subunit 3
MSGFDWGLHDPEPGPNPQLWAEPLHEHDMMSTRMLGFWLYMLSDSLIFAALFTAYEVLTFPMSFAGGPTPHDVASPVNGYIETIVLFSSVLAYGMVMVNLKAERVRPALAWMTLSLVIGLAFIGMETRDLQGLAAAGGPPQRSGFLSIFWTIVVVHGIHLAVGLLWMIVMLAQIASKGFTPLVTYRLGNLKVYWVYQGLIWTFVYTFVYLRGSI